MDTNDLQRPPSSDERFLPDDTSLLAALAAVVRALRVSAASDLELRAHLAVIGRALLEVATDAQEPQAQEGAQQASTAEGNGTTYDAVDDGAPQGAPFTEPAPAAADAPLPKPQSPPASLEDLQQLIRVMKGEEPRPGEASAAPPAWPIAPPLISRPAPDLQKIVDHCALKAAVAYWCGIQVPGKQTVTLPEEIATRSRAMPECRLWMLHANGAIAIAPAYGDMLSGCFQAAAEMVELILVMEAQAVVPAMSQGFLQLVAEVQSALRSAVQKVRPAARDDDQDALFWWVRERAERDHVYVPRYLRKDDSADWSVWQERLNRIRDLSAKTISAIKRHRIERKLLGRLRHQLHVGLPNARNAAEAEALWRRVGEVISQIVDNGVPPSSKSFRALLTPHLALLPSSLPLTPQTQAVVRAVREHNASRPSRTDEQDAAEAVEDLAIGQVADLLRDQTVAFIGGERRPYVQQAIEDAFDLAELVWCATQEGQGYLEMEPYIARPEVRLVLLAVRWASHNLSEVSVFCDRYNKPLVRLPAGYNPSQVAHQVLQQAGERLRAAQAQNE